MDNKRKEQNGELSTEELIRRLMENFSDEESDANDAVFAEEEQAEENVESIVPVEESEKKEEEPKEEKAPADQPLMAAVVLPEEAKNEEAPAIDAKEDVSESIDTLEESEDLADEDISDDMSEDVSDDITSELESVGTEKFKFRVQKSKVVMGAAIPKMTDSFEGVIGDGKEVGLFEEENDIGEWDSPLEMSESNGYAEIEQMAKEVLEQDKEEHSGEENLFNEADAAEFAQLSEDDVNLMMVFGEEGAEQEGADAESEAAEKTETKHKIEDEYDDPAKRDSFFAMYRKKYSRMNLRLALSALVLLLCGVIECVSFFGGELPGMLNAQKYPEIHLLIAVQLTLFCALVALPEIIYSVRSAMRGCPGPGILLTVGAAFNLVYEIMLAVSKNHVGTPTYNLPLALCAFIAVLSSWMHLKSEMMAFDVISTDGIKYTATRQKDAESELEKDAFDQYLDETPRIFGIQKTQFVSDFVASGQTYSKNKTVCGIIATLDVIVAIVFLILGYYRTGTLLDGLGYCQLALMFCLPISSFLVFGFPMYRASQKAYDIDSAIVGDASVDEYADASVVSFNDSDVFPSSGVKVRSIKLYGNSRIDKVLYTTAGVFDKLGGPLAEVFRHAIISLGGAEDVDLLESKPGGIEAAVDGVHVFCGSGAYINSCGFVPAYDENDVVIERDGKLSIMFVVIGKELAAKMYIEYRMDPEMKDIVTALYKAGMCMGVRTLDPNIDDNMLGRRIRLTEYPVRVLKCESKEQLSGVAEKVKSGVASAKSAKNLLKTLSLCDRMQILVRTGIAVKVLSVVVGIVATALVYAFGNFLEISSVYVLLYQLFWLIPSVILPMLFI